MRLLILFVLVVFFKPNFIFSQISDSSNKYQMGFFDLSIGLDTRIDHLLKYNSLSVDDYYGSKPLAPLTGNFIPAAMVGLSGRMQTSFFAQAFRHSMKRFLFGDVMAGEITSGIASSHIAQIKSGIWAAYRMELGGGFIFRINRSNDIGLHVTALKIAKDFITPFIFGSGITLRYRYLRYWVELGITSGRQLYGGWLETGPNAPPWQLVFTARYALGPGKNIGLRLENFRTNFSNPLYTGEGLEIMWGFKLFYGIFF